MVQPGWDLFNLLTNSLGLSLLLHSFNDLLDFATTFDHLLLVIIKGILFLQNWLCLGTRRLLWLFLLLWVEWCWHLLNYVIARLSQPRLHLLKRVFLAMDCLLNFGLITLELSLFHEPVLDDSDGSQICSCHLRHLVLLLSPQLFVLLLPHVCNTRLNITLNLEFLLFLSKNALKKPSENLTVVNFVASDIVHVLVHL